MGGILKRNLTGLALVLTYSAIAIVAFSYRGRELYPFFDWSLFSFSANPKRDTVVIVKSINGRPIEPTLFYDLDGQFSAAATRSAAFAKTLDLLKAARGTEAEARYRGLVEKQYFREANSIEYDLAQITYDPIERLETGRIDRTQILASYEKRDVR